MNFQLPFPRPVMRMMPPPFPMIAGSTPYQPSNFAQTSNNKKRDISIYKFVVKLSDGTQHYGTGLNKHQAKANAATQALFHLRPALIELENKIRMEKASSEKKDEQSEEKAEMSEEIDHLKSEQQSDQDEEWDENNDEDELYSEEKASTSENHSEAKKKKPKSVVSQVHECALRMKMNVEFEVVIKHNNPTL